MLLFIQLVILGISFTALVWMILAFVSGIVSGAHGVPYVPSSARLIPKLLLFGEVLPDDIFYDLGSGDGRMLLAARREFHVVRAIGYEVAPWPYWKSRWLIRRSGLISIKVYRKNFFHENFHDATCIYLYLFPKLVDRFAKKFASELKQGTRIISVSFPIDTHKHPQFQLKKSQKIGTITAYLYEKI